MAGSLLQMSAPAATSRARAKAAYPIGTMPRWSNHLNGLIFGTQ